MTARGVFELSSVFREVSRRALPSIVSIQTRGGSVAQPFGGDSRRLEEFLRENPEMRRFFGDLPNNPRSPGPDRRGTGSGFIIDAAGIIVTNAHVVRGADTVVVKLHDGREFKATEVKADDWSDVAIVKIDGPRDLKPLRFGDSDRMEVGDWVLAVGSPFGLDLSVTAGIISGKGRGAGIAGRENFLQTDAAVNPGNSGGPLLNLRGEVIGVNTAITSGNGTFNGVALAVPSGIARWVSDQLVEHGQVRRAWLGIQVGAVDAEVARQLNAPIGRGVVVGRVIAGSPAIAAGIKRDDIILKFNRQTVSNPSDLQGVVERLRVGKTYPVDLSRDGKPMTLEVTVAAMPTDFGESKLRPDPDRQR